MTPTQISNIYAALGELDGLVLPYKVSRKLTGLIRAVRSEYEAVIKAEAALVEQYGGKYSGNNITFADEVKAREFGAAYDKFRAEDDDTIAFAPVDISRYTAQLNISPRAVDALDGIVIFEEAGNGK